MKPLGNKLDFATVILGMMHTHGAANGLQLLTGRDAFFSVRFFHEADAHDLVVSLTDPFQGFLPRVLVYHYRLYLGRKERPIRNRQHVHAPGHHLLGQGKAFAMLVLANVLGHVLFEFLKRIVLRLVIHAASVHPERL